jgi:hypothetical protein
MMTELHSDGVRTIIVEKLDRLARDVVVQEACIADLRKNGFTLVSVAEPDLDGIRSDAVAQYDKSQIVAKPRGRAYGSARTSGITQKRPMVIT